LASLAFKMSPAAKRVHCGLPVWSFVMGWRSAILILSAWFFGLAIVIHSAEAAPALSCAAAAEAYDTSLTGLVAEIPPASSSVRQVPAEEGDGRLPKEKLAAAVATG
jgi:hypothetical protein